MGYWAVRRITIGRKGNQRSGVSKEVNREISMEIASVRWAARSTTAWSRRSEPLKLDFNLLYYDLDTFGKPRRCVTPVHPPPP